MSVLIYMSLIAGVYAGYVLVQRPDFLPVQQVEVPKHLQKVKAADVLQIVHQEMRGNFFTVDIVQLRKSLEKLPWVRHVNIQRGFPDRLTVELEEYQAFARWNQNALVDTEGEVFFVPDAKSQNLPILIAPDGTEKQVVASYKQFNQQVKEIDLSIKQLTLSPRHAWQLRLNNDIVLELGRENMKPRLARFITVYPSSLATLRNTVKQVDLRYRNGFAVQL
jgi:cell division protein FtsQ